MVVSLPAFLSDSVRTIGIGLYGARTPSMYSRQRDLFLQINTGTSDKKNQINPMSSEDICT